MSPNVINQKNLSETKVVQLNYSKPCQVDIDPTIYNEFNKRKMFDRKTHREYVYLCTPCCRFVPMNKDGLTCIKNHKQLLLKVHENELQTVNLSPESDRWRVERKTALNGLENRPIERPPSSSAVKKLYLDDPTATRRRLDIEVDKMVIAA